jgi:hypothetical protein
MLTVPPAFFARLAERGGKGRGPSSSVFRAEDGEIVQQKTGQIKSNGSDAMIVASRGPLAKAVFAAVLL